MKGSNLIGSELYKHSWKFPGEIVFVKENECLIDVVCKYCKTENVYFFLIF